MMNNLPHDLPDDGAPTNGSGHAQLTDRLYAERSLMGVYEQTGDSTQKPPVTRPQEVEPNSALWRRYHR